jgi:cyclic pyranopterin phosphate synthase
MTSFSTRLVDSFGRVHHNLRISVTDRCNIRCTYCMPESVAFLPRQDLLTFEEIERVVRVAAKLGIDKIRLTGGEPLVRRDLPKLVAMLSAIPGIDDLGLTTNGILLSELARPLRDAGLRRINISLDTMDPAKFRELTRRDGWEKVIDGIHAAKAAGFHPIKLNAIALKGLTESDIVPLGRFAREFGLELRFIEYMPLDVANAWDRNKVLLAEEILERLIAGVGPLAPAPNQDPRAPAVDYDYLDGLGRVGLIASVSRPFCATCNRLRLTADGKLRNCLFALEETDLRPLLRKNEPNDALISEALQTSVLGKWEGHEINTSRFIKPERLMHAIGG